MSVALVVNIAFACVLGVPENVQYINDSAWGQTQYKTAFFHVILNRLLFRAVVDSRFDSYSQSSSFMVGERHDFQIGKTDANGSRVVNVFSDAPVSTVMVELAAVLISSVPSDVPRQILVNDDLVE